MRRRTVATRLAMPLAGRCRAAAAERRPRCVPGHRGSAPEPPARLAAAGARLALCPARPGGWPAVTALAARSRCCACRPARCRAVRGQAQRRAATATPKFAGAASAPTAPRNPVGCRWPRARAALGGRPHPVPKAQPRPPKRRRWRARPRQRRDGCAACCDCGRQAWACDGAADEPEMKNGARISSAVHVVFKRASSRAASMSAVDLTNLPTRPTP